MRRKLFNFLSNVSLLCFLAAGSMWARSRSIADVVTHASAGRLRIISCDGGVFVESFRYKARYGDLPTPRSTSATLLTTFNEVPLDYSRDVLQTTLGGAIGIDATWRWTSGPPNVNALFGPLASEHGRLPALATGMAALVRSKDDRQFYYSVEEIRLTGSRAWVPYWCVATPAAVLPLLRVRSILLRRRQRLRASRHLCPACGYDLRASPDRCPECGRAAA